MILPTSHEQGKSKTKDRQFDPHLVVRETASYMQSTQNVVVCGFRV